MHCESAWSAIHCVRRAKCRSGALAGLRAAQSSGCVRADRARQSRLQNRTGHGVGEGVEAEEQGTTSGEDESGVEQCPHACDDIWRSYRFLSVDMRREHHALRFCNAGDSPFWCEDERVLPPYRLALRDRLARNKTLSLRFSKVAHLDLGRPFGNVQAFDQARAREDLSRRSAACRRCLHESSGLEDFTRAFLSYRPFWMGGKKQGMNLGNAKGRVVRFESKECSLEVFLGGCGGCSHMLLGVDGC